MDEEKDQRAAAGRMAVLRAMSDAVKGEVMLLENTVEEATKKKDFDALAKVVPALALIRQRVIQGTIETSAMIASIRNAARQEKPT